MSDQQLLERIVTHGSSTAEVLDEYEGLAAEDIQACLLLES